MSEGRVECKREFGWAKEGAQEYGWAAGLSLFGVITPCLLALP